MGVAELPDRRELAAFWRRWKIGELEIFGLATRDDFGPESDIDLLVEFEVGHHPGIDEYIAMHDELHALFGQ
ncbi:MAG: hypothetical protein CMJ31_04800 [Phycisphaerae bacterium]|nr:hypothetical protein [Phycisphaerae bacterium]